MKHPWRQPAKKNRGQQLPKSRWCSKAEEQQGRRGVLKILGREQGTLEDHPT